MLREAVMERGHKATQCGVTDQGNTEVEIGNRAELHAAHRAHRRCNALADIAAGTGLFGG